MGLHAHCQVSVSLQPEVSSVGWRALPMSPRGFIACTNPSTFLDGVRTGQLLSLEVQALWDGHSEHRGLQQLCAVARCVGTHISHFLLTSPARERERITQKANFLYGIKNKRQPPAQLFSAIHAHAAGASPVALLLMDG